jgi:hypothetical protein
MPRRSNAHHLVAADGSLGQDIQLGVPQNGLVSTWIAVCGSLLRIALIASQVMPFAARPAEKGRRFTGKVPFMLTRHTFAHAGLAAVHAALALVLLHDAAFVHAACVATAALIYGSLCWGPGERNGSEDNRG